MPDHQSCTWTGASGKKYIYEIYARHPKLPPNEPGNYIYAKMDEHRRWVPICIGEGNLTQRAKTDPDRVECTTDGKCGSCGAPCAGVFDRSPGTWGGKRLPVAMMAGAGTGGETNSPLYTCG